MSKITPFDRLFVTVTQNGISRLFTELSGVTSFSDIVTYIRKCEPRLLGMTQVAVRNTTEGWTDSRSVLLR